MVMQDTRRTLVKALGVIFAVLPQLAFAGFYLAFITLTNIATPMTGMTAPWMWNYYAFWLPLTVLLVEVLIVLGLYRIGQSHLESR